MPIKYSIYINTFGMIKLMYVYIYVDSNVGSAHACLNKVVFFKNVILLYLKWLPHIL